MATPKLATSLLEKYGALMTSGDLAELLGTTPKRISNGFANNLPWCRPFQRARIKIGRRVHLNTATVAEILEGIQATGADFSRTTPVHQVWRKQGPARGRHQHCFAGLWHGGSRLAAALWLPRRTRRLRRPLDQVIQPIALPYLA